MFESLAFGYFDDMAFGAADDGVLLTQFQFMVEPEEQSDAYEKKMTAVTQAAINFMAAYAVGAPVLQNAGLVARGIREYSNYWRMRYQREHGATTPVATNYVYENLFGGFSNYVKLMKFLDDQQKEVNRKMLNVASGMVGEVHADVENAKNKFFAEKLYPIARDGKVSQDQAMFLADIFQDRTYGTVTADELNQALGMVAPFLTATDMGSVMMFAPKLVLGLDLGSDSLHSDAGYLTEAERLREIQKVIADPGYHPSPVNPVPAQVADIRQKYAAIRSRIGSFLDPNMDSTFDAFIAVVAADSMDFKGSDLTLYQMYMNSVGRAVTTAFGLSYASGAQEASSVKAANDIAQDIIAKMMNDPHAKIPSADEIEQMIQSKSQAYVDSNWSGGGALTLIALAGAIWYYMRRR